MAACAQLQLWFHNCDFTTVKKYAFCSQRLSKTPEDAPRTPQEPSKSAQQRLRIAREQPENAPRASKNAPRAIQERPRAPRKCQDACYRFLVPVLESKMEAKISKIRYQKRHIAEIFIILLLSFFSFYFASLFWKKMLICNPPNPWKYRSRRGETLIFKKSRFLIFMKKKWKNIEFGISKMRILSRRMPK